MSGFDEVAARAIAQGASEHLVTAMHRGWDHASAIIDAMPQPDVPVDLVLRDLNARMVRLQEQARTALTGQTRSIDLWFVNGFSLRCDAWHACHTDDALFPTEADRLAADEAAAQRHGWPVVRET